jgi:hypothetical protein
MKNGAIWPDSEGNHINAHGGGILYHKDTFYWYGEFKREGWEAATICSHRAAPAGIPIRQGVPMPIKFWASGLNLVIPAGVSATGIIRVRRLPGEVRVPISGFPYNLKRMEPTQLPGNHVFHDSMYLTL